MELNIQYSVSRIVIFLQKITLQESNGYTEVSSAQKYPYLYFKFFPGYGLTESVDKRST